MIERPLATVGALIVASDGTVLLVRSKKWSDLFSIPGGKIELGETRETAVKREILEETGLKVSHVQFAMVQDCVFSPEFWQKRHFVMHSFIAILDPLSAKEHVVLNEEAYEFCWIAPLQALTLPLHHECRILIEWYLNQQKKKYLGVIGIYQHQIEAIVGIYPAERVKKQFLFIDGKVNYSFNSCLASNTVQDTLDYTQLAQICTDLAHEKEYFLLETFAADILQRWMECFAISWGWVKIKKPAAIPTADYAFVELEQTRD
jgi:dihydroneopterin aldolase